MKRILTIGYLILYLGIIVAATSDNLARGYPHWFTALGIVCRSGAAVCILLYIMRHRPRAPAFAWKLVPIVLIAFDVFACYYDTYVSFDPDETALLNLVAATIGVIILFPSWYLCFRFGYLKRMEKPSDNRPAGGDVQ